MGQIFRRFCALVGFIIMTTQVQAAILLGGHGDTLSLLSVESDGSVSEITSWSYSEELDDANLSEIHQVFDIQAHPTNGMIYVSSFNPCYSGVLGCWGNARIDKFAVSGSTINHMGAAIKFDSETFSDGQLSCAVSEVSPAGTDGENAPSDFIFSTDGTRMYVDDDCEDAVVILSINGAGDAEFISVGGDTEAHGFAYRDGLLYHGAKVFDVSGDTVSTLADGEIGTEQMFLSDGRLAYITGGGNGALKIAGVAAEVLTEVATISMPRVMDFATDDETTFFTGSREAVGLVGFDGTSFTLFAEEEVDVQVDGDDNATSVRGVEAFTEGGSLMGVAAAFSAGEDISFDTNGSAFIVYDLADSSITEVGSFAATGQARAILLLAESGTYGSGDEAVAVPGLPFYALLALGGLIGLVGLRKLKK